MNTSVIRKSFCTVLVVVLILALMPMTPSNAAESTTDAVFPVLNQTIVGKVNFQSFNFLGNNNKKIDGVDYSTTYYYTDDYFAPSAIHENATSQVEDWTALSDVEQSLATTSFDFTVASYTTNIGNVLPEGRNSWENTDYSNKDINAKNFLTECGFEDFESTNYFDAPTMDSIGYVLANKQITVFDEETNSNKEYTLVAVGIRGAGYGSEWASNLTIANSNDPTNVGRHKGFDDKAKEVCEGIKDYINDSGHTISGDVKYWVVGYSRAAAVANLTAAYLTDDTHDIYHTQKKDVYGYTFETPQAAKSSENALDYANIHNIINPMDAVPKVSPDEFEHQRLGVDYRIPFYQNTSDAENIEYYNRMYEILKTIAVAKDEDGEKDPILKAADPSVYPYRSYLPIYTMTVSKIIQDAIDDKLTTNFGTTLATGNNNRLGNVYMDQFIDKLIDVFLESGAWQDKEGAGISPSINRTVFIRDYQDSFRILLGYMLEFSGPAFLGMLDDVFTAIQNQFKVANVLNLTGLALSFSTFYNSPYGPSAFGYHTGIYKSAFTEDAQEMVVNIVKDMTYNKGFRSNQGISWSQVESALNKVTALVVNLYAYELDNYKANYFGTCLHYLNTILCTHEQEEVMSWNMALDPNHINRGYRTLTVPKDTCVKMYEFRDQYAQYEGMLSETGNGALVAKVANGDFISMEDPCGNPVDTLDQRISVTTNGNNMIIRYPSLLDIRLDITAINESTYFDDVSFAVSDYKTNMMTDAISDGFDQYDPEKTKTSNYSNIDSANTNADTINGYNRLRIPLSSHDVLQIMAKGSTTFDNSADIDKTVYSINKMVYVNTIVEGQFVTKDEGEIYQPIITDVQGEEYEPENLEADISYTSVHGISSNTVTETGKGNENPESHVGNRFTVNTPTVAKDNKIKQYFITNSKTENNRKMSSDTEAYPAENMVVQSTNQLTYNPGTSMADILSAEDQVYHVFYEGDLSGTFILVYPDGDEETIKVNVAANGYNVTQKVDEDMLYGGLFETASYDTPAATPGTKLIPKDGQKYYLREVPKNYLYVRNIVTTYAGKVRGSYAVAATDDAKYKEVGFLFKDSDDDDDDKVDMKQSSVESDGKSSLYESLIVNNKHTYTPADLLDITPVSSAKIAVARLGGQVNGTVQAYWITPDGVMVLGDNIRTLEGGKKSTSIADVEGKSKAYQENKDNGHEIVKYNGPMPVHAVFVPKDDEEEEIAADTGVKLAGYTTSLNGNIAMNFYLDLSDDVASDENAYMQFTLPGANTTAEKVMLSDATKQTRNGKTYYVFSAGVAAKEMTSDIKAQFVKGDGTKSPEWTYTIKEYCDYIRSHGEEYDAESIALAENMLLYGGNAQKYFKYNLDKPADADVDLALPEVNLDASFDTVVKGSCEGLTYLGSSAMLTTTTGLRHYFEFAGNAGDYTFTANGKKLKVESDKNGEYVLIDNIKAKDLKKPITLKVTDKAGNEFSLTYSVYTNIKQVINGDFESADKNLMKALYGYGEAAQAYFASR